MDDKLIYEIASFRYGLISPVVSRQDLMPGEAMALLRKIASKRYVIPGSTRTTIGLRTLQRYLSQYRKEGFDGLLPKPRRYCPRISQEAIDLAIALKRENPKRSIATIIEMLEGSGQVPRGYLKRSTLYDHFSKAGLTKPSQAERGLFRRYQALHRNERWVGDTCHLMYIDDPKRPGRKRKVYLIAWMDDYSRKVVHAQLYEAERLPMLEDSLKKAIITHGIPEQVYVDNGAMYSSNHFAKICARLGIHLSHSRPYRPQGRGKIERFFLSVQRGFLPELEALGRRGRIDLVQANELFSAWLKTHYNTRRHSATKEAPSVRFDKDPYPIRTANISELYEAFLVEEVRRVDKTGIVTLQGKTYEVSSRLVGHAVTLRFDPYDMEKVEVFFEGQRYEDAKPVEMPRHNVIEPHAACRNAKVEEERPGLMEGDMPFKGSFVKEGLSYKELLGGE